MTIRMLIIISTLSISFLSFAHNDNAYYYGTSDLPINKPWMNKINNDVKIRNISIPGTHGSAALYGGDIPRNQTLSIDQQLDAGIRFLDIRLRHIGNAFAIHHGPFYQRQMFGDILLVVKSFLENNPTEFVFIRVKEEYSAKNNSETFEDTFNRYVNSNSNIIWIPKSKAENPMIKEVRGKIVFLQNFASRKYGWFGLDYHNTFSIQDDHKLTSNWDLYAKWLKVKEHLIKANKNKQSQINFLSGSTGAFPYFVASGHSYQETKAPRLLTGLITQEWGSIYPDFPRVGCSIGLCSIAFEGTNTLTKNYIIDNRLEYVGIVVADFPGSGLINAIININLRNGYYITKDELR
ncbi:phosphatidylinositol-specific phospholipase C [Vibrio campbellii]|uniref:phosphatidylinositol-specific phospholipase C n=1 Tax=Vibrio campbellii TaxID=680 RepID=UPI00210A2797|nr:phosphatidylinositol-specific phospholipase C [Vibrio campbellii]UTZ38624.1 phosphatidylinositol-specific phospholipase C [Vibrio campbellii]